MAERIRDILSTMKLSPQESPKQNLEIESLIKESESLWLERNIEKYPIYFTGSEKAKQEIEKKIVESKEPFVITKRQTENGYKMLALSPSAAYGLIDGDDAKVVAGVFSFLQEEIRPKLGYYPEKFMISLKEICERLYMEKTGPNYKFIVRALRSVSGCAILQTDFFETRTKKGKKSCILTEKELRILSSVEIRKKDRLIDKGLKNKEYSIEIKLEDWIIQNLENYFSTKIDKELYFKKLDSQRARRLYTRLCSENFRKETELLTPEIVELLWITDGDSRNRKKSITRALDPLVETGFLESYTFDWDKIAFVFSKVRQQKNVILDPGEKTRIDSITLRILEVIGGIQSERLFRKIAQGVPEDVVSLCLSQVKELSHEGKIKESMVGYFVTLIAKECEKRGLKVPFKRKENTLKQVEKDGYR